MIVRAPVTPAVMKWARETARYTLRESANQLKRPISDIEEWENGKLLPTMPQARRAAKLYRRPLAAFYLPAPPKGWQILRDFRTLPSGSEIEYSREFEFLIRLVRTRQEWISSYLNNQGYESIDIYNYDHINFVPLELAEVIKQHIQITVGDIENCKSKYDALRLWIKKSEDSGIFIFRGRNIDLEEARGFALVDDYAPCIFINSNDAYSAQIFTIVHELAHLWINQPGISNLEKQGSKPDKESFEIEQFCNQVAAFILLEPNMFIQKWSEIYHEKSSIEDNINNISNYFKVSRTTIARRLLQESIISSKRYKILQNNFYLEWLDYCKKEKIRQKEGKMPPIYYPKKISELGKSYSRAVLGAYLSNDVTGRDAAVLLDMKINNFPKFAEKIGMAFGRVE